MKTKACIWSVVAAIAILIVPVQNAFSVPLITNGSLTGGLGTNVVPTGWSINAGSPDINDSTNNVGGAALFGVAPSGPSPDGGTFVGLGRNDADNGFYESFGQSVSGFAVGSQYTVSWYQGNFGADSTLNYLADNALELLVDGAVAGVGSTLTLGRNWSFESVTFTATAATQQLDFQLAYGPKSYLAIDGIGISSVPEPVTLGLLGGGLIGLGMMRRRPGSGKCDS